MQRPPPAEGPTSFSLQCLPPSAAAANRKLVLKGDRREEIFIKYCKEMSLIPFPCSFLFFYPVWSCGALLVRLGRKSAAGDATLPGGN